MRKWFGNQLPVYLSVENRQNRTMAASLIYIAVNLVLNFLFVQVLHLEAFGLALASSLGMWVFLAVQAQVFLSSKAHLRFRFRNLILRDGGEILRIRDDCVPFNPEQRKELTDPADFMKNAGIRLIYRIARDVDYQNLLGLNVLTIRI